MSALRKIAAFILGSFLTLFLFLLVIVSTLNLTIGRATTLKRWLKQSGVYSTAVDSALAQAKQSNKEQNSSGNVPFDSKEVGDAAHATFTPAFLESTANQVIDGVYHWLSGSVPSPDFKIDVGSVKSNFATNIGNIATQRVAALPVCPPKTPISSDFDAFAATCRPKGVDPSAAGDKIKNDLVGNKDFFPSATLTAADLTTTDNGQKVNVFTKLKRAPDVYQRVQTIPWFLGTLIVLCGVGIVFLNEKRRRGLRHVGVALLIMGLFLMLGVIAADIGFTKVQDKLSQQNASTAKALQDTATHLVQTAGHDISNLLLWFGASYIAIAGIIFAALFFTKDRPKTVSSKTTDPMPESPKPAEDKK